MFTYKRESKSVNTEFAVSKRFDVLPLLLCGYSRNEEARRVLAF